MAVIVFSGASLVAGAIFSRCGVTRRMTLAAVAGIRNMGPALAAVALSLHGDPAVRGALAVVARATVVCGLSAAVLPERRWATGGIGCADSP